jgi:hypothetical protein
MSTTSASTVYLQNVKLKALTRLGEVQPAIETKRREIEGLRNLRDAYEKNRSLGDAGSVMEVSHFCSISFIVLMSFPFARTSSRRLMRRLCSRSIRQN